MIDRICQAPACGTAFRAKPAEVAKGAARFCSRRCAYASMRVERPEHICAQCGQPSGLRAREVERGRKFCSKACYDEAKRKHDRPAELPCERCGTVYPTSGRAAGTRFCSQRCFGDSLRRPGAPPPCEQCGKARQWEYGTSVNSVGPYCSRACAGLAHRKRREVACQACGTSFQLRDSEREGRRSFHCSRACRNATAEQRATYATCKRDGCEVLLRVLPSQLAHGEGRYCSLRCRGIARRLRYPRVSVRCRGCRKRVTAPSWRKRAYCSLACTNRRRDRRHDPVVAQRNARILELHAQGVKAPEIQRQLAEDPAWLISPAAVRQVIHRVG